MKLKFIFLFVLFLNQLFSQNSGWEFVDESAHLITSLYEDNNGDLIAAMYPKDNFTKIIKLDKDGNQIKESFVSTDSMRIIIYKIVYIRSTDKYLLLGNSKLKNKNDESYKWYFVVVTMDMDLNEESIKVTRFDNSGEITNQNYYLTDDEKVLVSANVYSDGYEIVKEQVFVKLNKNGEIENYFIDKGDLECYSIIESNEGYQCIGKQIRNFDSNFVLVNIENKLFPFISSPSRAVRINENNILIGLLGTRIPALSTGGAVLYYVDNDMDIIKNNWIKTDLGPTTVNNVFDISPDSSIFIATYELHNKSFSVGKFDTNLNLLWQIKFENIGEYRYFLWGMEAANDNGIILYGNRRQWDNFNEVESYMIKFNSEGKITWTNNLGHPTFVSVRTYPNPSSGPLTIDIQGIIGKADIRIFDMSGRNVYVQEDISDGETIMDLSALKSGTYVYKVYQGSKEIGSGQWIKIY